jgi:segregation and condensation protein B
MEAERFKNILEVALLAAGRPLNMEVLLSLVRPQGVAAPAEGDEPAGGVDAVATPDGVPGRAEIQAALDALAADYAGRGLELKEVASGYRVQIRQDYAEALRPLWTERLARYSRALLETIALIAYRQPITRGEIEDIRGVSVSSSIMKTLMEREWVRVVGHRDVPGKPAMYGTTRQFLDHFNLKSLAELPTLAEIRDLDEITEDLFPDEAVPQPGRVAPVEPPDGFKDDLDLSSGHRGVPEGGAGDEGGSPETSEAAPAVAPQGLPVQPDSSSEPTQPAPEGEHSDERREHA